MSLRSVVISAVLALGACGGGSGSPVVHTSGAELESLGRYRTYAHATAQENPEGYAERGALRAEVLEKVRRDVDAELQKKGYAPDPNGELVVRISTGHRTTLEQPTGRSAAAGAPEKEQIEGALVIDILERASGKPLFHGFARDVVRGGKVEDAQIGQAVSKILEPIPTKTPSYR
jgi:hypothetical protein